jgi:hypothetical protein
MLDKASCVGAPTDSTFAPLILWIDTAITWALAKSRI